MPIIHVYVREGTPKETKAGIAKGIHRAMISEFGVPEDDYFQITHEKALEDMTFDRNYFGTRRSDHPIFISLTFNERPTEPKQRLFATIVENLTRDVGLPKEDIYMGINEAAPANWWAYARTINPETGTDSRMATPPAS